MCGIAGIYGFKKSIQPYKGYIARCEETMRRRGPDSNGTWCDDKNYIAGFVRLAIRDVTEAGDQPMQSSCGNYILTFNGEIYNSDNYIALLKTKGVAFKSHSDTEVLLYALIHLGLQKVLAEFDGMFSFAFFDRDMDKLILARDRVGIKPLYIGYSDNYLIYSSQYDHIINADFIKNNSINYNALAGYLRYGYQVAGEAVINNTMVMPPGHYITITNAGYEIKKFFDFAEGRHTLKTADNENIFRASVQSQLVSDVPVGTFLSGGVDSSLINFWATEKQPLKAFTIGTENSEYDESVYAKKFAEKIGVQHYFKTITEKDFLDLIDDNFKAFTEPFADFSSIPTMLVSKLAREKVTVILSGDGPDELFWGYDRNVNFPQKNDLFHQAKWKLLFQRFATDKNISTKYFTVPDISSFYIRSLQLYGAEYWMNKVYRYQPDHNNLYNALPEKFVNPRDINTSMQMVRWLEMNIHLQRILLKLDRSTMHYSLEARVPYLSNAVLDYASALDYTDCTGNGQGKTNIKAMLKKRVPREWVDKKKQGFLVPMSEWINKEIKTDIYETILNMPGELAVAFKQKNLKKMLDAQATGEIDANGFIWAVYALARWHAQYRNSALLHCS